MRFHEFLIESISYINQDSEGGSLEGYVADSSQPNIKNYLESQGVQADLINQLLKKYPKIGVIRNLYVDPEFRNQGIGNNLVSSAIDDAATMEANAVLLVADSSEDNEIDLANWYESFGFATVGTAGHDPLMVLEL